MELSAHHQRGADWRARATEALVPLTEPLAVAPGAKPAWDQIVMIDARAVQLAGECLARPTQGDDEYRETAANARRRVGLAVLRELRDRPMIDPLSAFEEVMVRRGERLPEHLLGWLDELGVGGTAALAAEAIGYASAVAGWVPPQRMGDVAISAPSEWLSWQVPGRALRIRARCDALVPRRARPPDRRLLVVANRLEHATEVAGHVALTYTLMASRVPARVTVLAPASGLVAIAVDDALLTDALERVTAAVYAAVAARFGPPAPTTPGRWCRHCPRLAECADGLTWTGAHPVRVGGLLPPS